MPEPRLAIGQVLAEAADSALGTAFAVSGRHLLTDRHVLLIPGPGLSDVVRVRFPEAGRGSAEVVVRVRRVADDPDLDIAVLETDEELTAGLTPLVPADAATGSSWRALGWSEMLRTAEVDGAWASGSFQGMTREHGRSALQLRCEQSSAGTPISLHGFSGAPVLPVSGRPDLFFGVIRWNPETAAAPRVALGGMVYACPAAEVTARFPAILAVANPYCGLRALTDRQGDVFFGRHDYVEELAAHLSRPRQRLTLLAGLPGGGKSSLVQAGLVRELRERPVSGPGWATDGWVVELHEVYDAPFRARLADLRTEPPVGAQQHLLVLDQFERFVADNPDLQTTADLIHVIENSWKTTILIVIRSDFLGVLEAGLPELHALADGSVLWPGNSLSLEDIQAMVEGPAERSGIRLETGVTEAIFTDLATLVPIRLSGRPGHRPKVAATTLPVLAIVLQRLGEVAAASRLITHAHYRSLGGLEGTLTRWADHIFSAIPEPVRARVDGLLLKLIRVGLNESEPDTRAVLRRSELVPDDDDELSRAYVALRDRQLVLERASDNDDRDPRVALVHDALIRDWKHLRDLVAQAHPALLWKATTFQPAYQVWQAERAVPGIGRRETLLAGRVLGEATDWPRKTPGLLDSNEQTFVARSRRVRRRRRVRRVTMAAVLVGCLVTATTLAWTQGRAATTGQRVSVSERLVTSAGDLRRSDPLTADQLVMEAFAQHAAEHTRSAVLAGTLEDAGRIRIGYGAGATVPTAQLGSVVALDDTGTSDRRCLGTVPVNGTAPTSEPTSKLCLHTEYPGTDIALSRNAAAVVSYGDGSRIHLWMNGALRWDSGVAADLRKVGYIPSDAAVANDGTVAQIVKNQLTLLGPDSGPSGVPTRQTLSLRAKDPVVQISDDGTVVLVSDALRVDKPEPALVLLRQSGGREYRVDTDVPAIGTDPVLSPDGRFVYSVRSRSPGIVLTRQNVRSNDGGDGFVAVPLPGAASGAAISPNGRMYVSDDPDLGFVRVDLGDPSRSIPVLPQGDADADPLRLWINDAGDVSAFSGLSKLEIIRAALATTAAITVPVTDSGPTSAATSGVDVIPVITDSGSAFFWIGSQAYVFGSAGLRRVQAADVVSMGPAGGDGFDAVTHDGQIVMIDTNGRSSHLGSIRSSEPEKAVVSGGVTAYITTQGVAVQRLSDHRTWLVPVDGRVDRLQLSVDGRNLLVWRVGQTQVWSSAGDVWQRIWQQGSVAPSSPGTTPPFDSASEPVLSSDGRHVVLSGSDGIRVQPVDGPTSTPILDPLALPAAPAVSADATRIAVPGDLVTSGDENSADIIDSISRQIWLRVLDPTPTTSPLASTSSAVARALSPDGRLLLMISSDSASIVQLDPGTWVHALCATLGPQGNLSSEDLSRYAAGLPARQISVCPDPAP